MDDRNGRRPQGKTTSMEDNIHGRQHKWKTTLMEDFINGEKIQWKRPKWKITSKEYDLNGI